MPEPLPGRAIPIKPENTESDIPDLSSIGLQFSEAINYINYLKRLEIEEEARMWLISAVTTIIKRLKAELEKLNQKVSQGNLKTPVWVTNPSRGISIPIRSLGLASRYNKQIVDSLETFLSACGFGRRVDQGGDNYDIVCTIYFPAAGQEGRYANMGAGGNIFDEDFQKKLFCTVKDLI